MGFNMWVRQIHRWLSIIFVVVVGAIFIAWNGQTTCQLGLFLPLFPLALLALTGLYLFVLPYVRRGGRRTGG